MELRSFIPPSNRPYVPGSRIDDNSIEPDCSIDNKYPDKAIFIISVKDDIVAEAFWDDFNNTNLPICRIFFDNLGYTWDFSYYNGNLSFVINGHIINPMAIYHRHPGCSVDQQFYHKHMSFFEVIDLWDGIMIGQKRDNFHNSSKMYQMAKSLRLAQEKAQCKEVVKMPRSFFVKGRLGELYKKIDGQFIVKSCSGVRSRVADEKEYSKWDLENLNNLPTLFQEKIDGQDVRIHICKTYKWALLITQKDNLDYRYSSKGTIRYKKIRLNRKLSAFCDAVSSIEQNSFVGIDFIKTVDGYYCLESNPSPGWSTFKHKSRMNFSEKVMLVLKGDSE